MTRLCQPNSFQLSWKSSTHDTKSTVQKQKPMKDRRTPSGQQTSDFKVSTTVQDASDYAAVATMKLCTHTR
ncbi:unnamed protein product [Phytophthora fragariaefolia]|uniref:Unnamed protein product n=1 Tax=Phytophthora fragariaefolia TaxID=1490495 RepID=A0A9W7CYA5_9STRA|nr:unnamed protein product [Phytophthora fragariaefolia]